MWASSVSQVRVTLTRLSGLSSSSRQLSPSHHLNTFPNFIGTVGPNVGLNSTRLTQLAYVSTVEQAFQRLSDAVPGDLAGHLFWQSFSDWQWSGRISVAHTKGISVAVMKIVKISVWWGRLIRSIFLSQVGSAACSFNLSHGLFYFWFPSLELNKMGLGYSSQMERLHRVAQL